MPKICAVILAGGEGKRMKSEKPKALTEVLSKPMLQWIIDSVRESEIEDICVVTGSKREYIDSYLSALPYSVNTAFQPVRLGTGHAVMMARDFIASCGGDVLVLGADAPFINKNTITRAYEQHKEQNNAVTVISAVIDEPFGYGRIVRKNGGLLKIAEQKNATDEEKLIKEINSGAYWFSCSDLLSVLDSIKTNSVTGEYYLTDAISLLIESGKNANAYISDDPDVILGANDPEQLEQLNRIAKQKFKID